MRRIFTRRFYAKSAADFMEPILFVKLPWQSAKVSVPGGRNRGESLLAFEK
jgi:hypothetical protein